MTPDELCEKNSKNKINFNIRVEEDMVFIEGDKKTLLFLSELVKSQAEFDLDDGFFIEPNMKYFNKGSKYGLYIFRKEK